MLMFIHSAGITRTSALGPSRTSQGWQKHVNEESRGKAKSIGEAGRRGKALRRAEGSWGRGGPGRGRAEEAGERAGGAGWRAGAGSARAPSRWAGAAAVRRRGEARAGAEGGRGGRRPILQGAPWDCRSCRGGGRPRSRGESRAAEAAVAELWALMGRGWTRALDRGEIAQSLRS